MDQLVKVLLSNQPPSAQFFQYLLHVLHIDSLYFSLSLNTLAHISMQAYGIQSLVLPNVCI